MTGSRSSVRTPSTGDVAPPPEADDRGAVPDALAKQEPHRARDPRADTHRNVKGRSAPRGPHERDESSDSGTGAPSELMKQAHDDVVSGKTGTDKGEVTEEVYRRTLRDETPGAERD
jgi:hypothetical protein